MMLYDNARKKWIQTYSEGYIFIVNREANACCISLAQSFKKHPILINKAIHATGMPAYKNALTILVLKELGGNVSF